VAAPAGRIAAVNAAAALAFLGLLALLVRVRRAESRSPAARRAALNGLIGYTLAASFGAGLLQRDAWPFARWPMAAGLASAAGEGTRLVAVDARGREWPVDYRAWQPLGFDELSPWLHRSFPRLPPAERRRVLEHLLEVAERARRNARAGGRVGYFDRYLGPFAAPYFDLHPRTWSTGQGAPPEPFTSLRVYRERWDHERLRRDPGSLQRTLFEEHSRP
jgi:hypothetical protein